MHGGHKGGKGLLPSNFFLIYVYLYKKIKFQPIYKYILHLPLKTKIMHSSLMINMSRLMLNRFIKILILFYKKFDIKL